MPLYDYLCPQCGEECERRAVVANRRDQKCDQCGTTLDIVIKPSSYFQPFKAGFDIGLGEDVTGQGHRNQLMRKNSLDYREPQSKGDLAVRLDKISERKRAREREGLRGTIYSR